MKKLSAAPFAIKRTALAKAVVAASLSGRQAKAKAELKGERLLVLGLDIVG